MFPRVEETLFKFPLSRAHTYSESAIIKQNNKMVPKDFQVLIPAFLNVLGYTLKRTKAVHEINKFGLSEWGFYPEKEPS
jgi:hypothetical protein